VTRNPHPWRAHRDPFILLLIVQLAAVGVGAQMVLAAFCLRRLESPGLVRAGAVFTVIPFSPAWLIGLPIGTWLMSVLGRPDVKAAFEQPTPRDGDTDDAGFGLNDWLKQPAGWGILVSLLGVVVSFLPWTRWSVVGTSFDQLGVECWQGRTTGALCVATILTLAALELFGGLGRWKSAVMVLCGTVTTTVSGWLLMDVLRGWRVSGGRWSADGIFGPLIDQILGQLGAGAHVGLYSMPVLGLALVVLGLLQLRRPKAQEAGGPALRLSHPTGAVATEPLAAPHKPDAPARDAEQIHAGENPSLALRASVPSGESAQAAPADYHGLPFYFVCLAVLALIGLAMSFAQSAWWLVTLLIPGFMIALQMEIQWRTVGGTIRLLVSLSGVLGLIAFGMWLEQSPWPLLALLVAGFPIAVVFFAYFFADEKAGDAEPGDEAEGEHAEGEDERDAAAPSGAPRRRLVPATVSLLIAAFLGWMLGPWALRYLLNQAKVRVDFETPGVQIALRQDDEEVARLSPKSTQAQLPPGWYEVVATSKPSHRVEKVRLYGYELLDYIGLTRPCSVQARTLSMVRCWNRTSAARSRSATPAAPRVRIASGESTRRASGMASDAFQNLSSSNNAAKPGSVASRCSRI